MGKIRLAKIFLFFLFVTGCVTVEPVTVPILEIKEIREPHEVLGPISVSEQISESQDEMVQGLAGFITRDGRVSDQIPSDMKVALDVKFSQSHRCREGYHDSLSKIR